MRKWLLWLPALVAAGCGGTPESKPMTAADMEKTALSDVGEMYRLYTFEKKKPPTKVSDFTPMEMMSPTGVRAVKTGEVVVRLGATMTDTAEGPGTGPGDEVLAYQKQVPESGGQVLMINRTIKMMTADEFKAAKLAGSSSSGDASAKEKGKGAAKSVKEDLRN